MDPRELGLPGQRMACSSFIWRMESYLHAAASAAAVQRPHSSYVHAGDIVWPAVIDIFRRARRSFFLFFVLFWRLPPTVGVCGIRWGRLPLKSHWHVGGELLVLHLTLGTGGSLPWQG